MDRALKNLKDKFVGPAVIRIKLNILSWIFSLRIQLPVLTVCFCAMFTCNALGYETGFIEKAFSFFAIYFILIFTVWLVAFHYGVYITEGDIKCIFWHCSICKWSEIEDIQVKENSLTLKYKGRKIVLSYKFFPDLKRKDVSSFIFERYKMAKSATPEKSNEGEED